MITVFPVSIVIFLIFQHHRHVYRCRKVDLTIWFGILSSIDRS